METKHSPGPWVFQNHGSLILDARKGSSQCTVAHVSISTYMDEGRYNARLIAAAPELLEALIAVLGIVEESSGVYGFHLNGALAEWDEFADEINSACAAIVKATGGEA